MSDITVSLGKQIYELRKQKRWTQETLAEKASLNTSYIVALEKGSKSASIDTLKKLAVAFELSLPELFSFDSNATTALDYEISGLLQEYTNKLQAVIKSSNKAND